MILPQVHLGNPERFTSSQSHLVDQKLSSKTIFIFRASPSIWYGLKGLELHE